LNPVETISWNSAATAMSRLGLVLPTGTQWEYAASAGTKTAFWTGEEASSVEGSGNVRDLAREKRVLTPVASRAPWDDGYACVAPIGRFRANPFGLHDTIGNVTEWTRDQWTRGTKAALVPGDGALQLPPSVTSDLLIRERGGSFFSTIDCDELSQAMEMNPPDSTSDSLGVRPARALWP
jgi:formylglycine-generating enzyme required for sulfatase activity